MNCNEINKPDRGIDQCNGYSVKDICVTITENYPQLDIYKGDDLNEAHRKIVLYLTEQIGLDPTKYYTKEEVDEIVPKSVKQLDGYNTLALKTDVEAEITNYLDVFNEEYQ